MMAMERATRSDAAKEQMLSEKAKDEKLEYKKGALKEQETERLY